MTKEILLQAGCANSLEQELTSVSVVAMRTIGRMQKRGLKHMRFETSNQTNRVGSAGVSFRGGGRSQKYVLLHIVPLTNANGR